MWERSGVEGVRGDGRGENGLRGIFGEGFEGILRVILSQCRELSMDSQIVRKFTLFSFNAPPAWISSVSRSFWGSIGRERYLLRPMHLLAELNIINKYKNAINCKKYLQ